MNSIKCIVIIVLSIIGPLNFSAAEEVKIPAEKVEAFTVDSVTGTRTDLVFHNKSHRWEIPISNLERAINPLAVKMPESFFVKDPTTGSIYPVRYEPYHEYVWARDDRSSQLKNPPVEFIADYYLPGEYAPRVLYYHIEASPTSFSDSESSKATQEQRQIPTFKGKQAAKPPDGEWQIPVFKGERKAKREREGYGDVPSGAVNPRTGQYYPATGEGAFDPKTGQYFPPTGGGYLNPRTGEFYPSVGRQKEKRGDADTGKKTEPNSEWQIPTFKGESVDESQWQIPVFKRRR